MLFISFSIFCLVALSVLAAAFFPEGSHAFLATFLVTSLAVPPTAIAGAIVPTANPSGIPPSTAALPISTFFCNAACSSIELVVPCTNSAPNILGGAHTTLPNVRTVGCIVANTPFVICVPHKPAPPNPGINLSCFTTIPALTFSDTSCKVENILISVSISGVNAFSPCSATYCSILALVLPLAKPVSSPSWTGIFPYTNATVYPKLSRPCRARVPLYSLNSSKAAAALPCSLAITRIAVVALSIYFLLYGCASCHILENSLSLACWSWFSFASLSKVAIT